MKGNNEFLGHSCTVFVDYCVDIIIRSRYGICMNSCFTIIRSIDSIPYDLIKYILPMVEFRVWDQILSHCIVSVNVCLLI